MKPGLKNLRDFIALLEKEGELIRVKSPVSAELEITEITDRVSKSKDGGKALLFENVKGHSMPVLINAMGSFKRMAMAMGGADISEAAGEITEFLELKGVPKTFSGKMNLLGKMVDLSKIDRKSVV